MAINKGNLDSYLTEKNNHLDLSVENIEGLKIAINENRVHTEGDDDENTISTDGSIGQLAINSTIDWDDSYYETEDEDGNKVIKRTTNATEKFEKIKSNLDTIARTDLTEDTIEDVNSNALFKEGAGKEWKKFGYASAKAAIVSIPGFSAIANTVNQFIPQDATGLNKALSGLDNKKDEYFNSIYYNTGTVMNDLTHFPTGAQESQKYGSMHSLPTTTGKFGEDIANAALNSLATLAGFSSYENMIDWSDDPEESALKLTAEETAKLNNITFDNFYDNDNRGTTIKSPRTMKNLMKNLVYFFDKGLESNKALAKGMKIGSIYVEPYMNTSIKSDNNLFGKPFSIPFEFNPEISEGGLKANYQTETLLGKSLAARYYVNTDSEPVTLKTKYIATSPNEETAKNQWGFDVEKFNEDWSVKKIKEVENYYRSLVFPFIDGNYLIKPPIVQIYIGNGHLNPTIANVLSYPLDTDAAKYFEYTKEFSDSTKKSSGEAKGGYNNVKRYVVTDVKIEDLENSNGWNYNQNARKGFQVTLTLAETTRNFLDTIPDYKTYFEFASSIAITNEPPINFNSSKTAKNGSYVNLGDNVEKAEKEIANIEEKIKETSKKIRNLKKEEFDEKINLIKLKLERAIDKSEFKELENQKTILENTYGKNFDIDKINNTKDMILEAGRKLYLFQDENGFNGWYKSVVSTGGSGEKALEKLIEAAMNLAGETEEMPGDLYIDRSSQEFKDAAWYLEHANDYNELVKKYYQKANDTVAKMEEVVNKEKDINRINSNIDDQLGQLNKEKQDYQKAVDAYKNIGAGKISSMFI